MQIEAANVIFERMPGWKYAVSTLKELGKRLPAFSDVDCLVKVAAINGLYSTNLYDVGLMARHVTEVFKDLNYRHCLASRSGCYDLVNKISRLKYPSGKTKWHVSFASKFCHFFVLSDFPILDKYVIASLQSHDDLFRDRSEEKRYENFASSIEKINCSTNHSIQDLDRYLWLRGMLLALEQSKAKLSREFRDVIDEGGSEIAVVKGNA